MRGIFSGNQPLPYSDDEQIYRYNLSEEAGNLHKMILAQKFYFQEFILKKYLRTDIRCFK